MKCALRNRIILSKMHETRSEINYPSILFCAGFDDYVRKLRPPLKLSDCPTTSRNYGRLNCRNPWFRQFWSHHFRCKFADQKHNEVPPELRGQDLALCTGKERLSKYEQEGLVPFVGELENRCASGASISEFNSRDLSLQSTRCTPWRMR